MPGAHDPPPAQIIQKPGCKPVRCSGNGFEIVACWPCEAEFGRDCNLAVTTGIANGQHPRHGGRRVRFPRAGGDSSTIRDFIKAGIAGTNIHDQVLGNPAPTRLIGQDEAAEKIKVTRAAARAKNPKQFMAIWGRKVVRASPQNCFLSRKTLCSNALQQHQRMGRDSNPRWTCAQSSFQDCRLRPLGHPSRSVSRAGPRRLRFVCRCTQSAPPRTTQDCWQSPIECG